MKDSQNRKNINRGITLISLMITVIIMLILAGIAMSLIIGENGIFTKSEYAQKEYEKAKKKEESELQDLYSSMMVATGEDSKITISMEDLKTLIKNEVQEEVQNLINSNNLKEYKAGKVTLPATSNYSAQDVKISFTEPFADKNYVVMLTPSHVGQYWASTSYTAIDLTENGFTISSYIDAAATVGARTVFWYAIPVKN